jgi:hypothetical protein
MTVIGVSGRELRRSVKEERVRGLTVKGFGRYIIVTSFKCQG